MFPSLRRWMYENFVAIMIAFILATLLNIAVVLNFVADIGALRTKCIKLEREIEADKNSDISNFKNVDESLTNHKIVIEAIIRELNGRDNHK